MQYTVRRATTAPQLQGNWDAPPWSLADVAPITHFHPAGTAHRPQAAAKMLYDSRGLYVSFRVSDQYILCRRTEHQQMVCQDSCVEAFLQPSPTGGYFNFEMNCGGTMLCYYVTDPARRPQGGLRESVPLPRPLLDQVRIYHSMPRSIPQEIPEPMQWTVEYFVPNHLFETYSGPLPPPGERQWRGNYHKCADESTHPHWGSWAPIGEALNFHVPQYFAPIHFDAD